MLIVYDVPLLVGALLLSLYFILITLVFHIIHSYIFLNFFYLSGKSPPYWVVALICYRELYVLVYDTLPHRF